MSTASLMWPAEPTPSVRRVLSMMCFQCIGLANHLRRNGATIARRAEDEQAAVLFFLMPFALAEPDEAKFIATVNLALGSRDGGQP